MLCIQKGESKMKVITSNKYQKRARVKLERMLKDNI